MAKVSSETADKVEDFGAALDRSSTVEGYTVNFVSISKAMDLAPMLASLAGRELLLPALGLHAHGADGRPLRRPRRGHLEPATRSTCRPATRPEAEAGTEFVQFSPADELAATDAAIARALRSEQPVTESAG